MEVQATKRVWAGSLNPMKTPKYIQCDNCNYVMKVNSKQLIPTEGYCPNCGKQLNFKNPPSYPNSYSADGQLLQLNDEFVKQQAKELVEHGFTKEELEENVKQESSTLEGLEPTVYREAMTAAKAYMSFYQYQQQKGKLDVQG